MKPKCYQLISAVAAILAVSLPFTSCGGGGGDLSSSYAQCVFVSGDDVYVAGYQGSGTKARATLWKNGSAQQLK